MAQDKGELKIKIRSYSPKSGALSRGILNDNVRSHKLAATVETGIGCVETEIYREAPIQLPDPMGDVARSRDDLGMAVVQRASTIA